MRKNEFTKMKKSNVGRRFAACSLSAALLMGICAPGAAALGEQTEPLELIGGLSNAAPSEYGLRHGGVPQTYYNYTDSAKPHLFARATLPEAFDLRKEGMVTTVKNQGQWGTCWAHGLTASLESNAIAQMGLQGGTELQKNPDYSEHQLSWLAYSPVSGFGDDTQKGEGLNYLGPEDNPEHKNVNGQMSQGAFRVTPVTFFSAWRGAVTEETLPYQGDANGNWAVDSSYDGQAVVHLQDAEYLPSPAVYKDGYDYDTGMPNGEYEFDPDAVTAIKTAMMQNGVVQFEYCQGDFFNKAYNACYVDKPMYTNHSICIVGWDDNYDKSNFKEGHQPPANGAWIARNSWGTGYHDDGFFYISYYDQSANNFTSTVADVADENGEFTYDHNYQYDFLGSQYNTTKPTEAESSIANTFTAKGDEVLSAVSATTLNPGSTVSISVYTDVEKNNPTSGKKVLDQEETVPFGGYHTLELDTPVALAAGETFSVVQTIKGSDGYYTPIEIGSTVSQGGYAEGGGTWETTGWNDFTTKIAEGQSFRTVDGSWQDLAQNPLEVVGFYGDIDKTATTGNVMIKAFTTDKETPVIASAPRADGNLEYGKPLADLPLVGGAATLGDGTAVAGSFAWADPSIVPEELGSANYDVVFTPADTLKFLPVTLKVSVHVEPVSKKALDKFIGIAEGLVADGSVDQLIPSVQKKFTAALATAKAVSSNDKAVYDQVFQAAKDLVTCIGYMDYVAADKEDLAFTVALADEMAKGLDKYVSAGKESFQAALAEAKEILANEDEWEQDKVDQAWDALAKTMSDLRLKADKSNLEALVAEASATNLSLYTDQSAAVFRTALQTANSVLTNEELSEDEQGVVNQAVETLNAAKDGLVLKTADAGEPSPNVSADPSKPSNSSSESKTSDTDTNSKKATASVQTGDSAAILAAGAVAILTGGVLTLSLRHRRKKH